MDATTLSSISAAIAYLAPKFFDKSFETATSELTKGAMKWLKSIFFKDEKPNQILEDLKENPSDELNLSAAEIAVQKNLQKNPEDIIWLQEIINNLKEKAANGDEGIQLILNSKNVLVAKEIRTGGGSIQIGDQTK